MTVEITAQMVKQLRDQTGAGPMDCKKALVASNGDMKAAAAAILEKNKGKGAALMSSGRKATEGLVVNYIHNDRVGAMVELNCETDFVARNDLFRQLARDIAQHIVGANPQYISREQIPAEKLAEFNGDEPRTKQYVNETVLLEQAFIRDPKKTIRDLITEAVGQLRENTQVRRFARFELGKDGATFVEAPAVTGEGVES